MNSFNGIGSTILLKMKLITRHRLTEVQVIVLFLLILLVSVQVHSQDASNTAEPTRAHLTDNNLSTEIVFLERVPMNAEKQVGLLWHKHSEFSPQSGQIATIRFSVLEDSLVTLNIHGPDGEVVRTLLADKKYSQGIHSVSWDGNDDDGQLVPDEVWLPVLSVTDSSGITTVDDSRRYSGGEIIPDIQWTARANTELSFDVPFPARVLIRTGINDGPMMRVLRRWEPVGAGKVVVRWDGFDANGIEEFSTRDDKWFVVMAYQLPEFAFISSGNDELNYREYRKLKSWPEPDFNLAKLKLQRDGIRLSRDYSLPRSFHPSVTISLAEELPVSRTGLPVVKERVQFKIDVPKDDRWVLDSAFYETGFYINYEFQSEEEQGFVPMIWDYDASKLPPGRHIATVQLFGFGGFITSATLAFEIHDR